MKTTANINYAMWVQGSWHGNTRVINLIPQEGIFFGNKLA